MARNHEEATGNFNTEDEILNLRNTPSRHTAQNRDAEHGQRVTQFEPQANVLLLELLQEIRELRIQMTGAARHEPNYDGQRRTTRHSHGALDLTYGRTQDDVRNQPSHRIGFLTLKEARNMIPEITGESRERVREFLSASNYAIKNIHPADESTLLEAMLCTKFKGKAMVDFETRDVQTYEQLRRELETEYLGKQSTTHLQLQFNSLKQKMGESAQEFGHRVEKIARELYEAIEEGQDHTQDQQRAILDSIKTQALHNYQIGLNEDIKLLVRAQRYQSLPEAIIGASAEEKVKGPARSGIPNRIKADTEYARNSTIKCHKCGKPGHYGRDCRVSRYASRFTLPKPTSSGVNTLQKSCTYCKKAGHLREECWNLHGRPEKARTYRPKRTDYKNKQINTATKIRPEKIRGRSTDSSTDSESGRERNERPAKSKARAAKEYHVTQIAAKSKKNGQLDLVTLPMLETKRGKLNFLLDSGATITLIKLGNLKDETPVYENRIALTGVTGHKLHTLGTVKATIHLGGKKLRHEMYVVKDDFPIEYEGILGIDFLKKHKAESDHGRKQLRVGNVTLKLQPYRKISLKPRSETIIQAITDENRVGIVKAEEVEPGIFIGCCLVDAKNFSCPISVVNSTQKAVEIYTPHVTLEDLLEENTADIFALETDEDRISEPSRRRQLRQQLRTEHLNREEKGALEEICDDYCDVFYLEGDPLTCTDTVTHKIPIRSDTAPVNVRPYRLPEKHKMEVNSQIKKMLSDNLIRPSKSQWNAPLLVVPKKPDAQGKPRLRVVVDFRKLNELTIGDSFPLPNITDILDQLGNAKYFTTLDLASGYHQVPMDEGDKEKTAFSTPDGHFEFNRMPFGLKSAPATFQRLMTVILMGMLGLKCLVYLDDIVVYGATLEEHNRRLKEVLERLRRHKLKLQPEKCQFLRKEVIYLGHIITEEGIRPDPSKLQAIKEFPTPRKVKDVQSFIGLSGYYRKFIENFSKIAKPLTKLTKKGEKFTWNTEQQNAFETLKEKLTSAPVLNYPDFSQRFLVTTDASDYAIGAVLSQGPVGQDRPIAYASRVLCKAEQNYNTTEKELLAIVWATKHFRPYLYGTEFTIITDHKPLTWLFSVNDPGSRLIRWRLKLEEYNYQVVYKAGKYNVNADALSRNPIAKPELSEVKINCAEERNGATKEYTEEEKRQILYEYHDSPIGGHQGITRTLNRIKLTHNWPGLSKDVENYINKCVHCQKNKLSSKTKMPMVITDTPSRPFEKCALDIVGPLTVTDNENKYILTFQDALTKFSKAIPIPNQEANTVAKEFVVKIILEHGIPEKILTDQGTNFLSEVFKNTCKLLRIEKIQTTAYHPESNGALERSHRTLAEYLRHYINADQTNWDEWTPYAMFAYNTTPHTATGFTPFELIYGYQAKLPTALLQVPKPTYAYDNYAQELREKLRATQQMAKEHLKHEKIKSKQQFDRKTNEKTFRAGDRVLLYDETVRRGRSKKLDSLWIGPYTVLNKNSNVNYTIKAGRKTIRVHANRLKHFIEN